MSQYGFCKIIELLFEKLLTKWGFCGIMCAVKICETNLLGLRPIRADARPVDLDFRDESLFECAAKPISLIIIYRYTKRSTEPTVFRNAEEVHLNRCILPQPRRQLPSLCKGRWHAKRGGRVVSVSFRQSLSRQTN